MSAQEDSIFTPELLDRCISCGFCLPACPTYGLTGVETSSPRGRINLMRALETGALGDDDPTVLEESTFCLGCRACEPVCPAGVQYGALLEEWRDHTWRGRRRPWRVRPLLWAVDRPWRVRLMGLVRRHARAGRPLARPRACCSAASSARCIPRVSRSARALSPGLVGAGRAGLLRRAARAQRRARARPRARTRARRGAAGNDRHDLRRMRRPPGRRARARAREGVLAVAGGERAARRRSLSSPRSGASACRTRAICATGSASGESRASCSRASANTSSCPARPRAAAPPAPTRSCAPTTAPACSTAISTRSPRPTSTCSWSSTRAATGSSSRASSAASSGRASCTSPSCSPQSAEFPPLRSRCARGDGA